ncbi:MAG: DNA glycosylase AlkZ-like family protein [Gemmatirosa sp.]
MLNETKLRAWWWHRQGLDGSLRGHAPADVLARSGWARSVGGAGPYLTLFARARTSRADAEAATAALQIHELPSARGCTYVLPADDFALGLAVGDGHRDAEMRTAEKLGVTRAEIDALCDAVLGALDGTRPLDPDAIRAATGDHSRSLGEAGKKKGLTTTLPIALGRLQARGEIRRVPVNGRLDQQRYAYVRWSPGPLASHTLSHEAALTELARRFFGWVGPATLGEFQWFSGLGVKATRDAVAPLGLVPADEGSDRLLLPDDVDAWRAFEAPESPQYALVSSLDAISAARRDVQLLLDATDRARSVLVEQGKERPIGNLSDLPSHAILDRGRLIGLWEFDVDAGTIAWGTFDRRRDAALEAAVATTEAFVREDLGDARSFSLDSPRSRAPRVAALRALQPTA